MGTEFGKVVLGAFATLVLFSFVIAVIAFFTWAIFQVLVYVVPFMFLAIFIIGLILLFINFVQFMFSK